MRMKNYEINGLANFLAKLDLEGKQSRMRIRFIKLLSERLQVVEEERVKLAEWFSEKKEDGSPVVIQQEDGSTAFKMENMDAFLKEFNILMNEDYIIDDNEERKDMLLTIQDAVMNTQMKFSGQDAFDHDRYCEIVETIYYTE